MANFFDAIRPMFGGKLTQNQVDGISETINVFEERGDGDVRKLAYILATGFHEAKFEPVHENLNYTTAARIREVWPSRFKTLDAAKPYVKNPQALANKVYNGRLGNAPGSDDGWQFRGRGWPQLTGRENYAKFGLDKTPDRLLEPKTSAWVLVAGMLGGKFTGVALRKFITKDHADYVGARAVVNADGKTNGAKIAGYAEKFEAALRKFNAPASEPVEIEEPPVPAPRPEPAPVPSPEPVAPAKGGIPSYALWVALIGMAAVFALTYFF
jgi:putative chitinase